MIRWLFVDIDDTLCNSSAAYRRALRACYQANRRTLPGVPWTRFAHAYAEARDQVHRRLAGTAAMHDRALYFEELLLRLKLRFSASLLKRLTNTYWQQTYRNLRAFSGVREVLRRLRKSGIHIGVVSDLLEEVQVQKLRRLNLGTYIDFLVTSEAVGHEKPHAAVFRAALRRARCSPREALVVGDSASRDIAGAKRLGLKAVLIGPGPRGKADRNLRYFRQLSPRLIDSLTTKR